MKTYAIELDGRPLTLLGLTKGVKEEITDIVRASELTRNQRLARKGLIEPETFTDVKQSILSIQFASEPVIMFLATPEGSKALMRAMVAEPISDAEAERLGELRREPETPIGSAVKLIFEEAYPKKKTAPQTPPSQTSTEIPTPGAQS